jgi:hypothetical protein
MFRQERPCARRLMTEFLTFGLPAAQPQNDPQAAKQETVANQAAPLKERHIPTSARSSGTCPWKSYVENSGDAKGNVSEARALSGPEELVPSALAWVRKWQRVRQRPRCAEARIHSHVCEVAAFRK